MNEITKYDNTKNEPNTVTMPSKELPSRHNTTAKNIYPIYDPTPPCTVFNEIITSYKDDRINTKRAISGSIASTEAVHTQNSRIIDMCDRELKRKDLTNEQRIELIHISQQAAISTADSDRENREFVREEAKHSHRAFYGFVFGIILFVGSKVFLKAS